MFKLYCTLYIPSHLSLANVHYLHHHWPQSHSTRVHFQDTAALFVIPHTSWNDPPHTFSQISVRKLSVLVVRHETKTHAWSQYTTSMYASTFSLNFVIVLNACFLSKQNVLSKLLNTRHEFSLWDTCTSPLDNCRWYDWRTTKYVGLKKGVLNSVIKIHFLAHSENVTSSSDTIIQRELAQHTQANTSIGLPVHVPVCSRVTPSSKLLVCHHRHLEDRFSQTYHFKFGVIRHTR